MIVLTLIILGIVFAVKEMWAVMGICLAIAFAIQMLASMGD